MSAKKKKRKKQKVSSSNRESQLTKTPSSGLSKRISILCLPGFESFLDNIISYLGTKYDVRMCYSSDKSEIVAAIRWAEVLWLEWCNELTMYVTTQQGTALQGKKVICRLHSYEALSGYVTQIDWRRIDDLVFVAEHVRDIVLQQLAGIGIHVLRFGIHVIPNGIDLSKCELRDRPRGKNVAFVANISHKKGPMLLVHAFHELVRHDPDYRLFVAGRIQDPRYDYYLKHIIEELDLEHHVRFDGYVEDVNAWLGDKHYIVCTSPWEGHPVGIMEAMECGIKPVIHNFVGANRIYPRKYIWNTIPEFIRMVTGDDYSPMEYRNTIEKQYSLGDQLERIESVISGMPITSTPRN